MLCYLKTLLRNFQYGHVSELQHQKIRDDEQQLLELFNLETAKLRILRNTLKQEEVERQQKLQEQEQQKILESSTKKLNSIIARASKEEEEEEAQVRPKNIKYTKKTQSNLI